MESVSLRLKELRKTAKPRLTVRKIADEMDIPFGTYSFYESASTYKKPYLPIDFARKAAAVMARYEIDPVKVMMLAGLVEDEALAEMRAIEAQRPSVQFVRMQVAFPSEAALTEMFEGLLSVVPVGASPAEAAKILARHLPSGFAAISTLLHDQGKASWPADVATQL